MTEELAIVEKSNSIVVSIYVVLPIIDLLKLDGFGEAGSAGRHSASIGPIVRAMTGIHKGSRSVRTEILSKTRREDQIR
jgi:hypothetical protein